MRKLALLFMVVLVSGATAMASDIAISTQAGWMGQGTADAEAQKIVNNVKGVSIQVFTPAQLDAIATWVKDHTGDGTPDLLIMFGNFPATIYPAGNAQPDGSIAELFLDDGNVIINTGDYIFYVGSNGNNNAGGLQNMMDVSGATMWGDDSGATTFVPTADGRLYTPSLPTLPSNRPWIPSQFAGTNWEVELILAQSSDGSQIHPAILHNTVTDGRLGVFFQWSDDAQPRGQVISEWINNWFLKFVAAGNPWARRPDPKDGAAVTQTWLSMSWTPGDFAVSHDVYMGETFEDVNSGAGTLRGNVPTPFFMVGLGLPGDPYPAGLVPGTTYYWRIDEVNPADPNSPWKGPVWSFSIPPLKAYRPVPADGAKYVATDVTLSWTGGLGAKLHYVYFGDNADTVANATGGAPRGVPNYTPAGPLVKGKTYYWRVDEFDAATTHKGDVWSFTTVPDIKITNPDLIGWWKFDEGQGKTALDFSGHGNDGTLRGDPLWVDGVMDGALDLSGNDYVTINGVVDDMTGTNVTLSAWVKTTQSTEGNVFAANDAASAHPILFGVSGGTAFVNDGTDTFFPPAINNDQWHMITYVRNGASGIIYLDGVQIGTYAAAWSKDTITRWSIGQEWDNATPSDFYRGQVDDARIYNKALTADEVKQLTRGDLLRAWGPSPSNWSTVGIEKAASLTWSKGDKASQHDVYFGLDKDAVTGADASDTTGVYRGRQSTTSYTPPEGVQFSSGPYYWRIDEVNTDGTITTGAIWSFSVADYALVEDFESYNDIPAGQPGSNLVYVTWLDGYGTTTNGSAMGYLQGASMETANVHGGTKSVPLIYNNGGTFAFSEAERTFAAQNWTTNGIKTLSLWFRGDGANLPGQLYVKINGVKVLYDGDASNLKKPIWQAWNIDLAAVGVNLQSVTKLAIGIDTKNATGTLLLDDIRLYPNARQLVTPVQPDPAGLVARYAFEGNANDSAGGHNGTPNGNPTYALGKIGQAISLDGLDDHVVVGSVGISGTAPRTIAGWAKASNMTFPAWVNVFGFTGPSGNNGHFDIELVGNTANTTLGWYGLHVYGWERNILPVDLTEWHHLAASYDGTTIKWYGDGLLVGSAARALNTPDNVHVGKRQDNTNFFPGLVDEVQIYSRVLSEAEVAGLAGVTKPIDKPF